MFNFLYSCLSLTVSLTLYLYLLYANVVNTLVHVLFLLFCQNWLETPNSYFLQHGIVNKMFYIGIGNGSANCLHNDRNIISNGNRLVQHSIL